MVHMYGHVDLRMLRVKPYKVRYQFYVRSDAITHSSFETYTYKC